MLAAVVDRDVTQQLDLPGVGVDLDDRDVRAERERRPVGHVVELVLQARRPCPSGRLAGILHRARELDPRQRARGHARDLEAAASPIDDVVGAGLEHVRGELLRLREHFLAGA